MIIIDEQTLLMGFLGMLIAATCMANILLALMLIDRTWRRHWQKKLMQQERIERYTQRCQEGEYYKWLLIHAEMSEQEREWLREAINLVE